VLLFVPLIEVLLYFAPSQGHSAKMQCNWTSAIALERLALTCLLSIVANSGCDCGLTVHTLLGIPKEVFTFGKRRIVIMGANF
jgi:hypothetical protein